MGQKDPTVSECLGQIGNILRGVYVYKSPGPWRTPKWVWPDKDRAAAGGAPKEALLKIYRELGCDQCEEEPGWQKCQFGVTREYP